VDPPSPFLKDFLGLVGVSVGPYVVREISSLGGVALVYRGEHETLHNAVAVKVLTPEVAAEPLRDTLEQLFLREAQILSQLRSEHILRAHHHGRVVCPADGRERPYLVVDWLEGHTLSDEIDARRKQRRPYGLLEAVELLEPVALALDAAHAAGIVHRDVNPRNIFLERTGLSQRAHAKLIDFGFAKDVAQTRALQLQSVHGTLLARSPDYAAPEHYDRKTYGELSENTDLYTFALCFVEMLTLEPPLRGTTPEALAEATSNPADRPTPNRRGAGVPQSVELLFAEALAIDQFQRSGSVLGWFRQLEQEVRRPATRPPPSPEREPRRRSRLVAAAVAAGLGLALGAYFLLRPAQCPPGFADCNGKRADGCEVELAANSSHCGGCDNACSTAHGAAVCQNGTCRIERCADERSRDCNGSALDGCEVDVWADPRNCGGCGNRCSEQGANKVACREGSCELTCRPQHGDCDRNPENGCEVLLASDAENCGRCGLGCRQTACVRGFCVPARLARLEEPFELAVRAGEVTVWEGKSRQLRRISTSGAERALGASIEHVTALAVSARGVLFASADPASVFELSNEADAGPARQLAGRLAGETGLVLDLDGRHVSFVDRSPRGKGKPPGAAAKQAVITLALDAEGELLSNQCPDWPARFAGDRRQQYCCDDTKPLASITCPGGKCTVRKHPIPCPELMVLDDDRLYFFRGTRLFAMERATAKAIQLSKRVRAPRELVQDGTHLYWIEGEQDAAIFRLRKPERAASIGDSPDTLAADLTRARALAVDESSIFWAVAGSGSGYELFSLKKPL
jgi:tRNA A-37 threonylcarbamoyl transferase component Bud32